MQGWCPLFLEEQPHSAEGGQCEYKIIINEYVPVITDVEFCIQLQWRRNRSGHIQLYM